jgi:predicted O-methyltransferase YrrM
MALRDRARTRTALTLKRLARALGQDLVARDFYSPVPAWEEFPDDLFERRSPLRGINFDLDAHLAFLQALEPFLVEFEPPPGFAWDNGMYDSVEADVLYAVVRHHRPKRVIELGSGYSSLIIAAAARRNAAEGNPVRYTAHDPFAREFVRKGVSGLELRPESAVDVPLDEFGALVAGDVLFIDTTHTVKLGSEVNHLILDVLPTIGPGVLVHVHDIFLPYEYPRAFPERMYYWAEQYLLQAFLAQNPAWDVVLPLNALVRERPDELTQLVRSFHRGAGPGAFWIRRNGGGPSTGS